MPREGKQYGNPGGIINVFAHEGTCSNYGGTIWPGPHQTDITQFVIMNQLPVDSDEGAAHFAAR